MAASWPLHKVHRSHFGKRQALSHPCEASPLAATAHDVSCTASTLGLWLDASIIIFSVCYRPAENCSAVKAISVVARTSKRFEIALVHHRAPAFVACPVSHVSEQQKERIG